MRIRDLPRRNWEDGVEALQTELTEILCTNPEPPFSLNAIQAATLWELHNMHRVMAVARVGAGKTMVGGLAGTITGASKVLYLTPGGVLKGTQKELANLKNLGWLVSPLLLRSFEWLARKEQAEWLTKCKPDLIFVDEAHKLKNKKASSVPKRIRDYIFLAEEQGVDLKLVFATGTPFHSSILDFSHMLVWLLGDGAPVPTHPDDQKMWSSVLDDGDPTHLRHMRIQMGAPELRNVEEAREHFASRLNETPGVIISNDQFNDVPLNVKCIEKPPVPETDEHQRVLKELWEAPDGWPLADMTTEVMAVEQELELGYYRTRDPWPPDSWMEIRSEWCKFVRKQTTREFGRLHTPAQVIEAVQSGNLEDYGLLKAWLKVEPEYEWHYIVKWIHDDAIQACVKWAEEHKRGLIWVDKTPFGLRLAKETGWRYFRSRAKDKDGMHITDCKDDISIASVGSCGTGLNLQFQYHEALFTCPPGSGLQADQTFARLHRPGQKHPVNIDLWYSCSSHLSRISKSLWKASINEQNLRQSMKLNHANFTKPTRPNNPSHSAWVKIQKA